MEHLCFDSLGSSVGCDSINLAVNLRSISQFNFELLKEKLRVFTSSIEDRAKMHLQECTTVASDLVPKVEFMRLVDLEGPSDEDLDKEIAMLQGQLEQVIEETAVL